MGDKEQAGESGLPRFPLLTSVRMPLQSFWHEIQCYHTGEEYDRAGTDAKTQAVSFSHYADGEGCDHRAEAPADIEGKASAHGPNLLGERLREVGPEQPEHAAETQSHHRTDPEQEHGIRDDDIQGNDDRIGKKGQHQRVSSAKLVSYVSIEDVADKRAGKDYDAEYAHVLDAQVPYPDKIGRDPGAHPPESAHLTSGRNGASDGKFGDSRLKQLTDAELFFLDNLFRIVGRHENPKQQSCDNRCPGKNENHAPVDLGSAGTAP